MIALYLQVLAVLALIAGAAVALGNETRLWVDERHDERAFARVGRHRAGPPWAVALRRKFDTAQLFAEADEAFNASAPTIYTERVIA